MTLLEKSDAGRPAGLLKRRCFWRLFVVVCRAIRSCLPGALLVFVIWLYCDWNSPLWVSAGAVWTGGNFAVTLERSSVSITNEYARRLTVYQIDPFKKLGSFPLFIDTGGHT
jgi:hypothetical protein